MGFSPQTKSKRYDMPQRLKKHLSIHPNYYRSTIVIWDTLYMFFCKKIKNKTNSKGNLTVYRTFKTTGKNFLAQHK